MSTTTDSDPEHFRKSYQKALAQTVSDESFNARSLGDLTRTLSDEESLAAPIVDGKLKQVLLDTLDDEQMGEKFIDFYPQNIEQFDREGDTKDENWTDSDEYADFFPISEDEAADRLDESGVPGRYEIVKLLGTGATGQVFAVKDNNLDRMLAVKFMHPKDVDKAEKNDRFLDEAATTAQLDHPNILPVHNLDYTDGAVPFFTMRLADGMSLEEAIAKKNFFGNSVIDSNLRKIEIILKVCDAIAYAHSKDIVHNDIKPGNIMVGEYGDVLVLDWGTSTTVEQRQAEQAKILGTPMYMSPEQARKECSDELSDIYCIGSTFMHLMTGRFPLYSDDAETFWQLKCDGYHKQFSEEELRVIPPRLAAIIEHCIAADRNERYQSVQELINDLDAFLKGEPVSVYQDPLADQLKRVYRRNKKTLAVIGLCAICAGLLGYFIYLEKLKELSEWTLVYENDFDNYTTASFSSEWKVMFMPGWDYETRVFLDPKEAKLWQLKDGQLYANVNAYSRNNGVSNLISNIQSSGNLKVTWEVTSLETARDMSMFIGGNDRFNAYHFHIAGFARNDQIRLTKYRTVEALDICTLNEPLRPNIAYQFTAQKIGPTVQLYLNDQLLIDYTDPIPYVGPEHEAFGFEVTDNNHLMIDNIRVWNQPLPQKINPIIIADDYFSHGHFDLALKTYRDILDTYPDSDMAAPALFRSTQCMQALEQDTDALIHLQQFLNTYTEHEYAIHAFINICSIHVDNSNWGKLEKHVRQHADSFKGRDELRWLYQSIGMHIAMKHGLTGERLEDPEHIRETIAAALEDLHFYTEHLGEIIEEERLAVYEQAKTELKKLGYYQDIIDLLPGTYHAVGAHLMLDQLDQATAMAPYGILVIRRHIEDENWDYIQPLLNHPAVEWERVIGRDRKLAEAVAPFASSNHYAHQLLAKPVSPPLTAEERLAARPNDFDTLVQLGRYEEARQLYENKQHINGKSWQYAQLLILMGEEDAVINSDNDNYAGVTKLKAYASKGLRQWMKGNKDAARKTFAEARAYAGPYLDDYTSYRILPVYLEWFEHRDEQRLHDDLMAFADEYQGRYNNSVRKRVEILLGLREPEPVTNPDRGLDTNGHFTQALRKIYSGDYQAAIDHFQETEYAYDGDRQLFEEYALQQLKEMLNE